MTNEEKILELLTAMNDRLGSLASDLTGIKSQLDDNTLIVKAMLYN